MKKRVFKVLRILLVFVIALFCFKKFMTYDRNYTWAKDYNYDIIAIAEKMVLNLMKLKK